MKVGTCPHCGGEVLLMKAATAEPKPRPAPTQPANEEVKLVTCNRCLEDNLTWVKSLKSGKPYLCKTQRDSTGKLVAMRREFHQCER